MRRIAVFAICLTLAFSVAVTAAPQTDTAQDIYLLTEGAVSQEFTYHGEGEPLFVTGRNNEQAVALRGTEYLTADISALQTPFTLSAWVNWQGDTADQRIFSLLKQDSENYLSLSPLVNTAAAGKPAVNGVTLLTSCSKEQLLQENYYNPAAEGVTDALPKNSWHHIAFTVNENDVTVYIDGVNWKTVTLPFAYAELEADTLSIGENGFIGQIQAFTVHTTPLDAAAVARMAQGISTDDTAPAVSVGSYAPATLPSAEMLHQTKSVAITANGDAVFADATSAFWEMPQVATGQTVTGTLTVENKSHNLVNLQLADIVLPAKDTPAYRYLSEVRVTIMQDSALLYTGPYTQLQANSLAWKWKDLPNDRQFTYTITLSRPFSSVAETVQTTVLWKWETSLMPTTQNPLHGVDTAGWLLIVLAVSAIAVSFSTYWAIVRRPRRIFTVWDSVANKIKSFFVKRSKTDKEMANATNEKKKKR